MDKNPRQNTYDVAIIGAGICGCSLLYALSRYNLKLLLLEKTNDVGVGTTKANSAILHAGYDPEPGTLMAKYNVEGNALAKQICKNLDVLMKETGSLVIGFNEEEYAEIKKLYERGLKNGVQDMCILEKTALHALEPNLNKNAIFALHAPSAAVVNPWELASAQAETAVQNGAHVWLGSKVTNIEKQQGGGFSITGEKGVATARFVINATGICADAVAELIAPKEFTIYPSRGEYYLLDKNQGDVVNNVVFQCPTPHGKGVLVAPTVHGNLICGPNAEAARDVSTTAKGLAYVKEMALKTAPGINFGQSIRNFAGLRAYSDRHDFIVGESETVKGLFNIAGIKSPGLTAAVAIAQAMVGHLADAGLKLKEKSKIITTRKIKRFNHMDERERAEAIKENPLYGRILCRCESVTEGEVVDALHRPLPPRSIDSVKRRCMPGMGRCQGGFCGPRVQQVIARELGISQMDVPQDDEGTNILMGRTKENR